MNNGDGPHTLRPTVLSPAADDFISELARVEGKVDIAITDIRAVTKELRAFRTILEHVAENTGGLSVRLDRVETEQAGMRGGLVEMGRAIDRTNASQNRAISDLTAFVNHAHPDVPDVADVTQQRPVVDIVKAAIVEDQLARTKSELYEFKAQTRHWSQKKREVVLTIFGGVTVGIVLTLLKVLLHW